MSMHASTRQSLLRLGFALGCLIGVVGSALGMEAVLRYCVGPAWSSLLTITALVMGLGHEVIGIYSTKKPTP